MDHRLSLVLVMVFNVVVHAFQSALLTEEKNRRVIFTLDT